MLATFTSKSHPASALLDEVRELPVDRNTAFCFPEACEELGVKVTHLSACDSARGPTKYIARTCFDKRCCSNVVMATTQAGRIKASLPIVSV